MTVEEKKQILENTPMKVGDLVSYKKRTYTIVKISDDGKTVTIKADYIIIDVSVDDKDLKRSIYRIGKNPFKKESPMSHCRQITSQIESVLFSYLNMEIDENYYWQNVKRNNLYDDKLFIKKGDNLVPIQRDYVWSLQDEQKFIESIFNYVDIGKVTFRIIWNTNDATKTVQVIDGKQRLNTLKRYVLDEFPTSDGIYWSDLSFECQHNFLRTPFTVLEVKDVSDNLVLELFITLNTCGKVMDSEHLEKISLLLK